MVTRFFSELLVYVSTDSRAFVMVASGLSHSVRFNFSSRIRLIISSRLCDKGLAMLATLTVARSLEGLAPFFPFSSDYLFATEESTLYSGGSGMGKCLSSSSSSSDSRASCTSLSTFVTFSFGTSFRNDGSIFAYSISNRYCVLGGASNLLNIVSKQKI